MIFRSLGNKQEAKVGDWKVDLAVILGALAVMGIALGLIALLAPQLPQYYQEIPMITF
jgi:hypothetical protein